LFGLTMERGSYRETAATAPILGNASALTG
jgi:hypothetical protein